MKANKEDYIKKSIEKFGETFDFSKTEDVNDYRDIVTIGCKKHGFFETTFVRHLRMVGGCIDCGKEINIKNSSHSFQKFLNDLEKVHPNKKWNIIGEYKNKNVPLMIEDKHGKCLMSPYTLLKGSNPSIKTAIDKTEYYVNQVTEVHGDTYSYEDTIYKGADNKIEIRCKIHGVIEQNPTSHLAGKGCKKCGHIKTTQPSIKTHEQFMEDLNKVHPDRDWDIIGEYKTAKTKIQLNTKYGICEMLPNTLLMGSVPSMISSINKTEYLKNRFVEIHANNYLYDKVIYISNKSKVTITCKEHGDFKQSVNEHLKGSGCPNCGLLNSFGMSKDSFSKVADGKKATLYLIKCWNEEEEFYKIGITLNKMSKRFSRKKSIMPYDYEVLFELKEEAGTVWDLEKYYHKKYKNIQYVPKIKFGGYTECFTLELPIEDIITD